MDLLTIFQDGLGAPAMRFPIPSAKPYLRTEYHLQGRMESVRGGLPEEGPVCLREPPEMPEAILQGDIRDCCGPWWRGPETTASHVHAAQGQVLLGAHPNLFLIGGAQRALWHPNDGADLRNMEWTVGVVVEGGAKPAHD